MKKNTYIYIYTKWKEHVWCADIDVVVVVEAAVDIHVMLRPHHQRHHQQPANRQCQSSELFHSFAIDMAKSVDTIIVGIWPDIWPFDIGK